MMIFVFMFCINAMAQQPVITSIEKNIASANESVFIKGSNFGSSITDVAVTFGAVKATTIVSVTDQLIEVKAPAGATYSNVSVTYLPSRLTAYSKEQFLLSFGGEPGININNLVGPTEFAADAEPYDLCMCDFDGDKKVDIAVTSSNTNIFSIYANNSVAGTVAFTRIPFTLGVYSLHARCGDLNGDAKPDLVIVANNSKEIYVFQNTSGGTGSFTFAAPIRLSLPGRDPQMVEIADLDKDGRPDIVFTDSQYTQSGPSTRDGVIGIFANKSTSSAIQIAPSPTYFTVYSETIPPERGASTEGIHIADLNGDGFPEVVTTRYLQTNSFLYVLTNTSAPGTINFGSALILDVKKGIRRIRLGDIDGDNKIDIAVTQLLAPSSITILLNKSSGSNIQFGGALEFATGVDKTSGLDMGDLDGDGKADIVATSIDDTAPPTKIIIFNNTSSPGNVSFNILTKTTTATTRHIQIADVDGDGKPDVAHTSISSSKISILRNKACMVPKITPEGPHSICSGTPLQLLTTTSLGVTYDWKNITTNTSVKNSADAFYDVTTTGNYQVVATAEGGTCVKTSTNSVNVTVSASLVTGTAAIFPAGPICTGSTLQLKVNDAGVSGVSGYRWTGPAGYTGTGLQPTAVTNFLPVNSGRYNLEVLAGAGCVAQRKSIDVGIIDIDDFKVITSGAPVLCQGDPPKMLSVSPAPADFNYEWFESTTGSVAVGPTSYGVSTSGEYYVKATSISGNCSNKQTDPVKIMVASIPVVSFTAPSVACKGQEIQFTNQSTTDPALQATYLWEFNNSKTSDELNPKNSFTVSPATAKLTISYNGACSVSSALKSITLSTPPVISITNPDNKYQVCVGEKLKLEVLGSFISYAWSTGENTPSIQVGGEGVYKVEVTTTNCKATAERVINELTPTVAVSASPAQIKEGQTAELTASGLESYLWSPAETLSNPAIASPIASPIVNTTYTVTGKDANGCTATGTLELIVIGEAIINKLTPSNFFSPNNSGPVESEVWQVDRILDFPQCNVVIYDDKGIKVFEAKPYVNDWDGTFKGKRLPDGVYYYVIKCDGEESKLKSGSITLLR